MKFICCIIFLLTPFTSARVLAQDTSYYTAVDKTTIFEEGFDSIEDTSWNSGHKCYYGIVQNGYYVYEVKKKQTFVRLFDVDLDTARNFEIEFVVNVPDRKSWHSWGVFSWGRQRAEKIGNSYSMTIHEDGKLYVVYGDPHSRNRSQRLHRSLDIKINGYNKYTIRRKGDWYILYVNERFIGSFPYEPLRTRTMGLGAGAENKLGMAIFDYFKVSYLQ